MRSIKANTYESVNGFLLCDKGDEMGSTSTNAANRVVK